MILTTPPAPKRALDAPTQIQHPWRATLRTVLAAIIGIIVTLPPAWSIVQEEVAKAGLILPAWLTQALTLAAIICVVIIAVVQRIIVLPAVSAALTKIGLGPAPKVADRPID